MGYSPAGPAHSPTEDIAYMRSLCGIEIYSPCNSKMAEKLVDLTCAEPKLRYIRLERAYAPGLENVVYDLKSGAHNIPFYDLRTTLLKEPSVCIVTSGYMLGRALHVAEMLQHATVTVIDLFKIKPINTAVFEGLTEDFSFIVTLEEQTLSAGFGSAVCETNADLGLNKKILRIGLPEGYIFQNGTRDYLLDNNGLSVEAICEQINEFVK